MLAAADDAEDMSGGNYTARVLLFHDTATTLREGLPNVQVCITTAPLPQAPECLKATYHRGDSRRKQTSASSGPTLPR